MMTPGLRNLFVGEEGATVVEYAVLAAMIAGVVIAAIAALGGTVSGFFASFATELENHL